MDASRTRSDTLCIIPLFGRLSDEGLRWVAAHVIAESRGAHAVIFAEGAPADALVLFQTAWFAYRRACDCGRMAAYADCGRIERLLNQSLPPDSALG